jgi:hypothetical protein
MATANTIDVLNELLRLEYRSLPMYVIGTSPWQHEGDERAAATLSRIVEDQKRLSARIADLILERGGQVQPGAFPMEFTDLNLLSLDYLVREAINHQKYTIGQIESCVARLAHDAEARHLAEEVLGNQRGHLENLEELLKTPV